MSIVLRVSRASARWGVLSVDRISSTRVGHLPGVRKALSGVNNRIAPVVLRSLYRPGPQMVNGVLMIIPEPPAWGGGGEFHMAVGSYERRELSYILDTLAPGDCFVDVGAHIGYFTLPVARRVGPSGRVIAIEPTPASAGLLRNNLSLNGFDWVTLVEAAASDAPGHARLIVSDTSAMWNTLELGTLEGPTGDQLVRACTVDQVLAEQGWPSVTWIKMDVEGHEEVVLHGCAKTLDRFPSVRIMFEVSGGITEREEASMRTVDFLSSSGFEFLSLDRQARPIDLAAIRERMSAERWQESLFNLVARRRS